MWAEGILCGVVGSVSNESALTQRVYMFSDREN